MADELTIFAEIEAVLENRDETRLDRLEHTLTSGYAAALALEAERWRIERRIAEAAALVRGSGDAEEIAVLARSLNTADSDLTRLRSMLARLRERTTAARAA